jgi:hypothetical protein
MGAFFYQGSDKFMKVTPEVTPGPHYKNYLRKLTEFKELSNLAITVWESLPQPVLQDDSLNYALEIYTKLIGHALSLHKILPPKESKPGVYFDISSISAIARCMMESYDALAYISLHQISREEEKFRRLLWIAHDLDRRLKMSKKLQAYEESNHIFKIVRAKPRYLDVFSKLPDYDESLSRLAGLKDAAVEDLKRNSFFSSLHQQQKNRLLKEFPAYHISQKERNLASGVNEHYYTGADVLLSQYVHTYAFSVHNLNQVKPGSDAAYRDICAPLTHAMTFLAKSISEVQSKWPCCDFSIEKINLIEGCVVFAHGINID